MQQQQQRQQQQQPVPIKRNGLINTEAELMQQIAWKPPVDLTFSRGTCKSGQLWVLGRWTAHQQELRYAVAYVQGCAMVKVPSAVPGTHAARRMHVTASYVISGYSVCL